MAENIKGIWSSNSVENPPDLSTLKSKGYPTNGDPARGIPPTLPGAAWFYLLDYARNSLIKAVAEEIDPTRPEQFIEALKSLKWIQPGSITSEMLKDSVVGATESQKGVVELATTEETQLGTDNTRAVTPKGLKEAGIVGVSDATEEVKGKVQLATSTEIQTGTDATKAITPKALKDAGIAEILQATIDLAGKVELATSEEVAAGTDDTRAITPKALKDAGIGAGTEGNYLPLTGGTVTGATTFTGALKSGSTGNLDLSTKLVKAVSISGRNITFTFNDGTTQTITTQDTTGSSGDVWTVSKGTNGWARDNSNGFTVQWGFTGKSVTGKTLTFARTFTTIYSVAMACGSDDYFASMTTKSFDVLSVDSTVLVSYVAIGFT